MNCDCIIVCNGPSLKDIDFRHFEGKAVFTANRSYLSFKEFPENIKHFHVVVNELVAQQFSNDLRNLDCDLYTLSRYKKYFGDGSNINYITDVPGIGFISKNSEFAYIGATVTFVMLQLAVSLGYKKIGIVGLDHSFSISGQPHKNLDGLKEDVNHYVSNYFPKGISWQAPDLLESELNYTIAELYSSKLGFEILNYSTKSELNIFAKYRYDPELGFTNEMVSPRHISIEQLAASYASESNSGRMPILGNLIFSKWFKFAYLFALLLLFIFYFFVGPVISDILISLSITFLPFLMRKIVNWIKAFRRRVRLEMIFSHLSMLV
ncbi:hypothetical protein ATY35_16835 [Vibrio cidicii]|uniref:DUF115 domain-containing protein n=1 Tax=Vibrio cidicii TaxID=1763883 RepID=A0ABR5W1I1_9VIBR|nr:hypothetical protein [Vibrio cidicii]KYN85336.1 hypothetical protein ATY35_16835 [Vibrio cidicii]